MDKTTHTPDEGWDWLINATKWHYFDASGRSLCGKWLYWGKVDPKNPSEQSKCVACRRKAEKRLHVKAE